MIKIDNCTNLDYETIGRMIDRYRDSSVGSTFYDGKTERFGFVVNHKNYQVDVTYQKTLCKFIFKEIKNDKKR